MEKKKNSLDFRRLERIKMEKIIEIDILDKHDLVEKYNDQKLASDLISYILEQAMFIKKQDKVKIIIDKKCDIDINVEDIIKNGLKEEYDKLVRIYQLTNIKQVILFVLGITFLFLSSLVEEGIGKEILLISGWVPIWETIEIELFGDLEVKRKRNILKKLLKSTIELKK